MRRHFMIALAPAFIVLGACEAKTESAATPAVDSAAVHSAAVAPAPLDSGAVAAADSLATLVRDSAARPAMPAKPTMSVPAPAKVETGDYDKAIRPKFKIDEKTGKIDTIKRP
ncbi:MAG: hypothetical protein C0497_15065 [Gemmatimonas sp.]|nr:hypothetical protein [Gemmatimonas sp.]